MKKTIAVVSTAAVLVGGSVEMTRDQYVIWDQQQLKAYKADRVDKMMMKEGMIIEPIIMYHAFMGCNPKTQPQTDCSQCCCKPCEDKPDAPDIPDKPGTQEVDYSVKYVQGVEAQKINNASSIIVAVLDTGVDKNHEDLDKQIIGGRNFTGGNSSDFTDRQGHGTHTAGSVAATNNSVGVVGSSQAKLWIGKVLGDDGSGSNDIIANGIVASVQAGAKVISMSLGGPQPSQAIHQAVRHALSHGVAVVAAAGNDGGTQPNYPAGYPGVIPVTAMDQNYQKANFSSYGQHVAERGMTCPGVNVISTMPGGRYGPMSGTSMATPVCAGVIALAIAANKPLKFKQVGQPIWAGRGMPLAWESVK